MILRNFLNFEYVSFCEICRAGIGVMPSLDFATTCIRTAVGTKNSLPRKATPIT